MAGYASFDAETWVIDIAPFNLREAGLTAVQTVGNGLAFLAVWRKWGGEVSEIKTPPIIGMDENGDETITFNANHTLGDIARWICQNRSEAYEVHRMIGDMLNGVDGRVMQ